MEAVHSTFRLNNISWPALALSLVTIVFLATIRQVLKTSNSCIRLLPVPDGAHFIWGHERQVFMNQPGTVYGQWMKQYGKVFRAKAAFGAPDNLILADPVAVAYLLRKKVYHYHHSALVRPRVARLMGKGLGWVEGEHEHKEMRRLTMPALTADNIRRMSPIITECAAKVSSDLVKSVQKKGGKTEVNLLHWTGKAILSIVGRVAFLYNFDEDKNEEGRKILDARRQGVSQITRYAGFLTLMLLRRFTFLNYLPIRAIQGQALARDAINAGVTQELLLRSEEHVADVQADGAKDLLTILLAAVEENKIQIGDIHNHISTFIIAGFETTATTIAYAIWELARYPEKQRRLRDELAIVPGQPTFKDMQERLPYLDAIFKETLRLYPALAYMERVSISPDIIPLRDPVKLSTGKVITEIAIQPGQTVIIPIMSIQRQPDVWMDSDTFKPERWLEESMLSDQSSLAQESMLAFSDGPRSCIGSHLATFNFKAVLSSLVTRFEFEDTKVDMKVIISSSLQPWVYRTKEDLGSNELPVVFHVI